MVVNSWKGAPTRLSGGMGYETEAELRYEVGLRSRPCAKREKIRDNKAPPSRTTLRSMSNISFLNFFLLTKARSYSICRRLKLRTSLPHKGGALSTRHPRRSTAWLPLS